ncbi:MAG: EAL domain-containing protein [Gammaproteobacteria bacterium]|nr:EAL domain-containing protein [Gammaproteobacteria bacterium]
MTLQTDECLGMFKCFASNSHGTAMEIRIVIQLLNSEPQTYEFLHSPVQLGRGSDNDLVIQDRQVSSRHGRLEITQDGLLYRDLGSRNGSHVARDGRRIAIDATRGYKLLLKPDDQLLIGNLVKPIRVAAQFIAGSQELGANEPEQTSTAKNTRVVELTARLGVNEEIIDKLSSNFDRKALLTLYGHSLAMTRISRITALTDHFARCAFEVLGKATHVCVYPRYNDSELPAFSRDRAGSAQETVISSTVRESVLERSEAVAFIDSGSESDSTASLRLSEVRAGLCAPVKKGEEIIGFVQADRRGEWLDTFDDKDLEVFAVLTHQYALAVENIALTDKLRHTVDALEVARGEMEQLAFYDALTGLHNRRLFLDRLQQAVDAAARKGRRVCLLYLDLDHFKRINDTLGHDVGDQLIRAVAERLKQSVRNNDTVARLGGDEFSILLEEIHGMEAVHAVCNKLLGALRAPIAIRGRMLNTTTSIGIALSSGGHEDATTLLKNADMALYKAKQSARDTYRFFTDELNREVSQRVILEAQLRQAIANGELRQMFQPLIDLRSNRRVAVEALLRWQHPTRGLLSPSEFIWLAEESGLIVPIGEWAMREACKKLHHAGPRCAALRLSVNVSARQLADARFADRVRSILGESRLSPSRVELEVTESMLMNAPQASVNLHRLKELGVSLAIDDFGTGYSSFSYLKELPVEVLKIDRSFVQRIPETLRDAAITSAIIAMGHKLGMRVVAEGIETEQQLLFLQQNGCDIGQGFLLGAPAEL